MYAVRETEGEINIADWKQQIRDQLDPNNRYESVNLEQNWTSRKHQEEQEDREGTWLKKSRIYSNVLTRKETTNKSPSYKPTNQMKVTDKSVYQDNKVKQPISASRQHINTRTAGKVKEKEWTEQNEQNNILTTAVRKLRPLSQRKMGFNHQPDSRQQETGNSHYDK